MIETPEPGSVADRAQRVLVAHGRAPNIVRALNDEERANLAELWQDGKLIDGAGELFRAVMIDFSERMKATDESDEPPFHGVQVPQQETARVGDNPQPSAGRE